MACVKLCQIIKGKNCRLKPEMNKANEEERETKRNRARIQRKKVLIMMKIVTETASTGASNDKISGENNLLLVQ